MLNPIALRQAKTLWIYGVLACLSAIELSNLSDRANQAWKKMKPYQRFWGTQKEHLFQGNKGTKAKF